MFKLIVKQKFCASSWLIAEINILRCTVSKRSKHKNSHRAPPQVADRGRLTGYGGYWGNKIPRVDQNQHHCLVEKGGGPLQRLGEETPTENQPARRLRWQPHH